MKKALPTRQLKSLCDDFKQDIVDGPFGSELKSEDYITEGIPVLKIQNVKPFAINLKRMDYVSPEKHRELRRHSFRRGDIIMTKLGSPLGVSAIVEGLEDGVIVADLVRIRAQQINTKYLCYHLNSPQTKDFINSMQKGTTRPRVTLSVVRELPIFAPPLAEQMRIVALLDEAFAGIDEAKVKTEANLENAKALFNSHVQAIFNQGAEGWRNTRLEEISANLDSKRVPITKNIRASGEFPYYGASGIVDYVESYIFEGDNLLVSEDGANLLARSTPIAFSVTGKYWVNNHAHILHFENMATQRFVEFYLESIKLDGYITGAAQPKLTQKALNSIPIPIPDSIKEQGVIVRSVESLKQETTVLSRFYELKMDELKELKSSLLSKAFAGELTA